MSVIQSYCNVSINYVHVLFTFSVMKKPETKETDRSVQGHIGSGVLIIGERIPATVHCLCVHISSEENSKGLTVILGKKKMHVH